MRAPVILSVFWTALRAWWDDDAPRCGWESAVLAAERALDSLTQRSTNRP